MADLKGKKVVFTGALTNQTRSQATKAAEKRGCKVAASISKAVDYVVIGENAGQKADKAESLGIKCLTEDEWEDMLSGNSAKKARLDSPELDDSENMESHEEGARHDLDLKGKKVVFTGALKNQTRNQATKDAEMHGCKVTASISKAVDYVVIGENAGQKADKAESMGIKCLTESEWADVLSRNSAKEDGDSASKGSNSAKKGGNSAKKGDILNRKWGTSSKKGGKSAKKGGNSAKKARLDSPELGDSENMESDEEGAKSDLDLKGKKVVFTGTLKNQTRNQATKDAERHGCKVATSISKAVDYVIIGENAGQKADKAKSLGIQCLTENEWDDVMGGKGGSSRQAVSQVKSGGPKRKCRYWDKCFRTNKNHLQLFLHPEKPQLKSTYSIEPANTEQACTFADVPDVALLHLFQLFNMEDLVNLLRVCKRWNELIEPNDNLWRKFIPNIAGFDPPDAESAKGVVESIWRKSIKIGEERWYPDVSPAFIARVAEMKKCSQWGFSGRDPMRAGATLYLRLNPIYDFVKKGARPSNKKLRGMMKEIYETFNRGKPYFDPEKDSYEDDADECDPDSADIKDEKDVMEKSQLNDYCDTLTYVQRIVEPPYATEHYDIEPRDLEGFSHLNEIINDSPPAYVYEGSDSEDEDMQMLLKHYKTPKLSVYKEVMEIICGEDDTAKTRQFFLNDGCFNENYEYSWEILIGPYAAVYESRFFDL